MRSWRSCGNPAVIAIAPLTAVLVMTAAVSAVTEAKDDGVTCDERSFAPDNAALRVGQAIGTGRIRIFGGTAAIAPGQALLLGPSRPGYVCALYANGLEAKADWVPQAGVGPAVRPVDPAPPLATWIGTWRQYDNKIVLTRNGDRLSSHRANHMSQLRVPAPTGIAAHHILALELATPVSEALQR